ncbi:MAG TPA: adenylate/guanylate cyclase domain-containing protein [Gammaproteobacteria bacterium]|nr:adenylate/guanylate cyclase domain-containing protein [Gammaproteobacteria bacterium]
MQIRHLVRIAISLVLFLIFAAYIGRALPLRLLDQLEHYAYDARIRLTMPDALDPRIAIVDIDDQTLRDKGWPLSRDLYAQLVNRLFQTYHVKLVAFDIMFPDPDRSRDLSLLDSLAAGALKNDSAFNAVAQKLRPGLERDRMFVQSLEHRPVILGYVFSGAANFKEQQSSGRLPPPAVADVSSRYPHLDLPKALAYTGNYPLFAQAAAGQGFFSSPNDEDGSFRRVWLAYEYKGNLYASLDIAVLRVLQNQAPLKFVFDTADPSQFDARHLDALAVGDAVIPVNHDLAALVPYRGPVRSFPYVSAERVMDGKADPAVLKDAIVYVGTTSAGLQDLRTTPVGNAYPGVEVHANFLSGVLDQRIKNAQPQYGSGALILLLLCIGGIVTWFSIRSSIAVNSLVAAVLFSAIIVSNLLIWQYGNFVFPLAAPLIFLLILFVLHALYGFFIESRGKRHLSRMFSQYIPPELVEEMDQQQEAYSMDSDSRELTVMFSDVRGFTSISEGLDPKDLSQLMNEFLTPMTRIIHTHRGTIDKYMGDAIMAFWGAPLQDSQHAQHALEAALAMHAALAGLNAEFAGRGWPTLRIGIGVNTGNMNVGDMGSEFRRAYTVMGDAVNLGSRLEGLTKQYAVTVICSESTRAAVPEFSYLELDQVRVKGKEQPVAIYEPLGPRDSVDKGLRSLLTRHKQALAYYRTQHWDSAEREFFALQQAMPERARTLYGLYLDRISYFRAHSPGEGWDGVFTFTTK